MKTQAQRSFKGRRPPRPKPPREVALWVLYHVDTRKAFADLLLGRALRTGSMVPKDAALATELVNGTLRWRGRIDWVLSKYVKNGLDTLPPWVRNGLRLGLYQLLFLDRIPDHAAVDESVKLARMYGHSGTAGLTNAVLRKILAERDVLPDPETTMADKVEGLSVAYSHPRWLVDRWLGRLGEDETKALLRANNKPAGLCLRVNPMRTNWVALQTALAEHGIAAEPGAYSKHTLRVSGNMMPTKIPEFLAGHFFIQDESETLVADLLDARPGESIVDLCAAPGGKACQIQEGRDCKGTLLAVDVQMNRLGRVRENIERLGLSNITVVCADGRENVISGHVDKVLVDAPCSGLGVLGRRADARWRKTEISLRGLLGLEQELLAAGSDLVRPGGVLVYSVCSTEPEEGMGQIQKFLKTHTDFALEDAGEFAPPEVVTDRCLLLYPHRHGTDGVFAARLRRGTSEGKGNGSEAGA